MLRKFCLIWVSFSARLPFDTQPLVVSLSPLLSFLASFFSLCVYHFESTMWRAPKPPLWYAVTGIFITKKSESFLQWISVSWKLPFCKYRNVLILVMYLRTSSPFQALSKRNEWLWLLRSDLLLLWDHLSYVTFLLMFCKLLDSFMINENYFKLNNSSYAEHFELNYSCFGLWAKNEI